MASAKAQKAYRERLKQESRERGLSLHAIKRERSGISAVAAKVESEGRMDAELESESLRWLEQRGHA